MITGFKINTINSLQFFQLFRYGIMLLIGIILSKAGLSLYEIGTYETLMLFANAVSFFWLSGIVSSLLSLYKEPADGSKSRILFTAFVLISICSVIGFVGIRFSLNSILRILNYPNEAEHFKTFSWYILLNSPCILIEYIFLLKNKPKQIIIYAVLFFTLQLFAVILPVLIYGNIEYSIILLVILAALKFSILLVLLFKHALFLIDREQIKLHLTIAAPLVASTLLSGSAEYIDGLLVSHKYGTEGLAIYQYGARELPFTLLLANAMSAAMIPYFSNEKIQDTLKRIKQKSERLMHVLFPISIVLLLISNKVYPIVFSPDFKESAQVFNVFLLLIISRLVFPQSILIGIKKNKIILAVSAIELVLNVGFSIYFMSFLGIIGIALGTVVAYIIEKTILIWYLSEYIDIFPEKYIPIKTLFIYSGLIISVYLLTL